MARLLPGGSAGGLRPAPGVVALLLLAAPALAQDGGIEAPCLEPRADLPAYVAAFEAQGWTRAEGDALDRALLAQSQFRHLHTTFAQGFAIPAITDADAFDAVAREAGPLFAEDAAILVRDKSSVAVHLGELPPTTRLSCLFVGPSLPDVDARLATQASVPGDFQLSGTNDFVDGAWRQVSAYRYDGATPRPLLGAAALVVTVTWEAAP